MILILIIAGLASMIAILTLTAPILAARPLTNIEI